MPLYSVIPPIFIPLFGLGSAFAFILGVRALRLKKDLPSYQILTLVIATIGIIFGIIELGHFFWLSNFF
jgi:EamA domain-containing membrane protein RarD